MSLGKGLSVHFFVTTTGIQADHCADHKLVSHLNEVDADCTEIAERAAKEIAKAEGTTDELKEENQRKTIYKLV